jgi:ankyrin repeat protein
MMCVSSAQSSFYYEAERATRQTTLELDQKAKTNEKKPEPLPNDPPGESFSSYGIDYLQGLFDTPEAIFERNHVFCFPALPNGEMPCTDAELQQILRELAIGVYQHNVMPEVTLGTNQKADHFPKIHPAFQNTLVGRVISMLSYMMKGYLDGGILTEAFIDEWHVNPDWQSKKNSAMKNLIDFSTYCRLHLSGEDKNYKSFRVFLKEFALLRKKTNLSVESQTKLEASSTLDQGEDTLLCSFTGFKNTFRIVSKQNSVKKEGNVFLIDADFGIEYTLRSSTEYFSAFEKHLRRHETLPASYSAMEDFYTFFCKRVHDHMAKLPVFKKYFAMLPVIDFFSRYFFTLKKHRKVPILPSVPSTGLKKCPPLFPPLPISNRIDESLQYDLQVMMKGISSQDLIQINAYCRKLYAHLLTNSPRPSEIEKNNILEIIKIAIYHNFIHSVSPQVRHVAKNKIERSKQIQQDIDKLANDFFEKIEIAAEENVKDLSSGLLERICKKMPEKNVEEIVRDAIQTDSPAFHTFFQQMFENFLTTDKKIPDAKVTYALTTSIFKHITNIKISETRDLLEKLSQICRSVVEETTSCVSLMSKKEQKFQIPILITEVFFQSEMDLAKIEKEVHIITGCNLQLQKQAIQTSEATANILRTCWVKFQKIKSETWTEILLDNTQSKGFALSLAFEDMRGVEGGQFFSNPRISQDDDLARTHHFFERIREEIPRSLLVNKAHLPKDFLKRATILHSLAQSSNIDLLKLCVDKGLAIDSSDSKGMLPIHYASLYGQTETVEAIIAIQKKQLNAVVISTMTPNNQGEQALNVFEGETPLLLAAEGNHTKTIQLLLQHHADTEVQTKHGLNVLSMLASKGTKAALELFFPYKISKDPRKICQAIAHAIANDNLDIIIPLYGRGIPINLALMNGVTGLQLAARHGALLTTHWLLQRGADPLAAGPTGENALQLSAVNHSWKQFKLILEFTKSDLDACINGQETLLHTASKAGNLKHVMCLISRKASLDVKDHQGFVPLHRALQGGHVAVARMLLACGANSSIKTADGKDIHELIQANDQIMQLVIQEYTVAVEESEKLQDSQLHFAVRCQDPLAVLLQTHLVNVNLVNSLEETALHLAVELNQEKSCLHLLQAGANIALKNYAGDTSKDIARKKSFSLIELLLNASVEK